MPKDQAEGLPTIDIPVVLLGRLAVDRAVPGRRMAEYLLIDALRRSNHLARQIGIRAIEVHAINAAALLHGLTLVTHNTADFQRIPGIRLADWLAS